MKPNENMDQLVETKLTKTEAIDLVIEEMKSEIEFKREKLADENRRLRDTLTVKALLPLIEAGAITVEEPTSWRPKEYEVTIKVRAGIGRFPVSLQPKMERLVEIHKEQEELGKKLHELSESKSKVRNAILKTLLEGTEGGQKFLQLLTDLRIRVTPKLNAAQKKLLA